jgi:hypothetical protein
MKTKYFESKPGVLVCALTGTEYKYNVSDKASRIAAANKLAAHQSAELERTNRPMPRRQHEVVHPETRTKEEIRAAEMAKHRRPQPTGVKVVNPFEGAMERATARRGRLWAESESGRKYRLDMEAASTEWKAKQQAKGQQADFEKSIAPVVDHARSNFEAVRNDPTATQLEVEQAEERYKLAQSGNVSEYTVADKEWRQRQSEKIVAQAVEVDSQLNRLRQQRDQLLQAAYEKPAESEPTMVEVWYPPNYIDPAKAGKTVLEPMPK